MLHTIALLHAAVVAPPLDPLTLIANKAEQGSTLRSYQPLPGCAMATLALG